MMSIIIYSSKYGATTQYARWLGEMLNVPVTPTEDMINGELKKYNVVFIGTSVYFGKFRNAVWLKQNAKDLSTKKIYFFIVTASSDNEKELRQKMIDDNVPAELKPKCEFFFLPGRVIHRQLSFFDRLALKIAGLFEKNPIKKQALRTDLDGVKEENLSQIVYTVWRRLALS